MMPNKGSHHQIIYDGDIVRKEPTEASPINFTMALDSVRFFKDRFGSIIPETTVVKRGESYIATQQFVDGSLLRDVLQQDLTYEQLLQFLNFIERSIYILIFEGKFFDITGFQSDKPYTVIENESLFRKTLRHYNCVKDFFSSTNFMLSGEGKVYFVDNLSSYGVFDKKRSDDLGLQVYRLFILLGYRKQILALLKKQKR